MGTPKLLATLAVCGSLFTTTAFADPVWIQIDPDADVVRRPAATISKAGPLTASKVVGEPATRFLLPHFKIDSTNPFGETTFVTIRNESDATTTATVNLYRQNEGIPNDTITVTLAPKEVRPLDLGGVTTIEPGFAGLIRGWGLIEADTDLTVDLFQVNTSQDFAVGATGVLNEEVCYRARTRFLVGGGFSGGTEVTFLVNEPMGADPDNDPASARVGVFDETGMEIAAFLLYTEEFSFQIQASAFVPDGVVGGVLEVTFLGAESGGVGGFLSAEFKANDRFSAALVGACLERAFEAP